MIEIFEELPELLIETVIEPDRYIVADLVEYVVPDDLLVFVNRPPTKAVSPSEETLTLEDLRRNMNRNKEADRK